MGQRQPFSAADDSAWLSHLVDTMDRVEQMHDEPCDEVLMSAMMARLKSPATTFGDMTRSGDLLELSF